MNAALLVAHEYPDLPQLRRGLSSTIELEHIRSIFRARTMLADPRFTILILDCAGNGEAECDLLRWVEDNRPDIECIVLTGTEHFCAPRETRRRNLYRILKPTDWREVEQITRRREPLSLPVLRDWMPYFISGREEEFCRCIEDYFHQAIAANNMDRAFLARFQQDFIQELAFALKNAGIPLHDLFPGTDELLWMEAAIRYVPDMLS